MHDTVFMRRLRALGLRQADFAALFGLTPQAVSSWSRGTQPAPAWVDTLLTLLEEDVPPERVAARVEAVRAARRATTKKPARRGPAGLESNSSDSRFPSQRPGGIGSGAASSQSIRLCWRARHCSAAVRTARHHAQTS